MDCPKIPVICPIELCVLSRLIRPLVRRDGVLFYVVPCSLDQSFEVNPYLLNPVTDLQKLATIETFHPSEDIGFLTTRLIDILPQIPREFVGIVRGLEVDISHGFKRIDGGHIAFSILYS